MSFNARRMTRKNNRPGWQRSHREKPERPGDRKVRDRACRERRRASRGYRGGLL